MAVIILLLRYVSSPITNLDGLSTTHLQSAGDLWYFPAGIPHSLQATADDPDGSEFLLVRLDFYKHSSIALIFSQLGLP